MKKWKLSIKVKQVLSIIFMVVSVAFFIALFALKDKINNFASKSLQISKTSFEVKKSESAYVDSAYNYEKNGLTYEITFLEFGAKACSACKRMESVMDEIRAKYPKRVNVVFLNVMLPENQILMKYFGVVAIPTQVLLNKEGKEFFRHTGYYSSEEFVEKIQ